MKKPIVSFDLTESRFTAGDAAVYVENNDAEQFGREIIELIDDPRRRQAMGEFGIKRVREVLAWEHSKHHLWNAYEKAFAG